ncbi:MerR family transcriptional regulator [Salinactinospora qingdaonensis]|uniref:MerR family transcriptional regulator n=1 Tax=Salinactinospora qingdaonensis TaxID=702744 RepID=UPI0031ED8F01
MSNGLVGLSLEVEVDLKSTGPGDDPASPSAQHHSGLVPIGEAARRAGVAASALRYYEERGLLAPAARIGGRRHYGPVELRRIAFISLASHLGVPLEAIAAMLDGHNWHDALNTQIEALNRRIEAAERVRDLLGHALECPNSDPLNECDYLTEALDARMAAAAHRPPNADTDHLPFPEHW